MTWQVGKSRFLLCEEWSRGSLASGLIRKKSFILTTTVPLTGLVQLAGGERTSLSTPALLPREELPCAQASLSLEGTDLLSGYPVSYTGSLQVYWGPRFLPVFQTIGYDLSYILVSKKRTKRKHLPEVVCTISSQNFISCPHPVTRPGTPHFFFPRQSPAG